MRTFIAIDLDATVRRQIDRLQQKLRADCPTAGLRWVDAERIHLTLRFLGEIADGQAADVAGAVENLAGQCRPFEIAIGRIGTFPADGPVRVVWIGVEDPNGDLARCHSMSEALLVRLGFPPEGRPFSAHLTLARNKNPKNSRRVREALALHGDCELGSLGVDHVTFYQSTLTPTGPTHAPLCTCRFRG